MVFIPYHAEISQTIWVPLILKDIRLHQKLCNRKCGSNSVDNVAEKVMGGRFGHWVCFSSLIVFMHIDAKRGQENHTSESDHSAIQTQD